MTCCFANAGDMSSIKTKKKKTLGVIHPLKKKIKTRYAGLSFQVQACLGFMLG